MASRPLRTCGILVGLLVGGAASGDEPAADATRRPPGAQIEVVVPSGALQPGRGATLYVAVTGADGPAERAPSLALSAGAATAQGPIAPGIWAWHVVPPIDASGPIEAHVTADALAHTVALEVRPPPASRLEVPERIDGVARGGEVKFVVRAEELPPEARQVVVGEGRVVGTSPVEGGVEVRVLPDDIPFPRAIPVGVRDRRRDEQPAWSWIRLRARPSIPLVSEPGSTVQLVVAGRTYGPFVADDAGNVTGWVEQLPGDLVAQATVTDDLGNETRTDVPLAASTHPALVAFPSHPIAPGAPPPVVWLHALAADGSRWTGGSPTCRTPTSDLPVGAIDRGLWITALPRASGASDGVRVECALGPWTATSFRVPAAEGVPDRLRMRVWPMELRSDFPSAEVHVVLEDTRGERLPIDGVVVTADHGEVRLEPAGDTAARGEYVGDAAVGFGRDRVTARYEPPTPGVLVERLRVAWGDVPGSGRLTMHGRALDRVLRPVPGVPLTLDAGGDGVTAVTGPDGWASAEVAVPPGTGPLVLRVSDGEREERIPVLRGQGARGGPGTADLEDRLEVTIDPGRVAGISVSVEPANLRAGPGSVAWIEVALEDRGGSAVTDERVTLEVSEGTVGEPRLRPDGTFVAEYVPLAVDRARDVLVTAKTDTLRSSATLHLQPRDVRVSVGPWVGFQTNFGAVAAPVVGLDADFRVRTRALGESGILRLSGASYTFTARADAGIAGPAELRTTVFPVGATLMLRQDVGPVGIWAGAGATVAVYRMQLRLRDALVSAGTKAVGGPSVSAGIGRRALGGEIFATVGWSYLPTTGGDFGFTGNLGGLATGLGYRVVF